MCTTIGILFFATQILCVNFEMIIVEMLDHLHLQEIEAECKKDESYFQFCMQKNCDIVKDGFSL